MMVGRAVVAAELPLLPGQNACRPTKTLRRDQITIRKRSNCLGSWRRLRKRVWCKSGSNGCDL